LFRKYENLDFSQHYGHSKPATGISLLLRVLVEIYVLKGESFRPFDGDVGIPCYTVSRRTVSKMKDSQGNINDLFYIFSPEFVWRDCRKQGNPHKAR
jgi:hypothetical protein